MPALFTSPTRGSSPSASRAAAIWSASVTSMRVVRRPRASSRSASSSLRTAAIGSKPSSRRCRTVASPMPVEAPVTRTVPVAMAKNLSASFAGVDVDDAIRTRRTHKAYRSEPVPRETLDELFDLARWAPNHNLTNPWRFRVLGPESLARAEGGRRRGGRGEARPRTDARGGFGDRERRPDPGRGGPCGSRRGGVHRAARGTRSRARGLLAHAGGSADGRRLLRGRRARRRARDRPASPGPSTSGEGASGAAAARRLRNVPAVIPRADALASLERDNFDLVVVGGGITGAGVALDAASRGYSVALVEKSDFAAGTSSRSSKLIHGGLRYLQNFDLGLVREALLERSLLVKLAPHIVKPLPFVVPTFGGKRPDRVLGMGLNMYDVMSWRRGRDESEAWSPERHRTIDGAEVIEMVPALAGREPTAGYLFYDCQTDDVRLVLTVLAEAERFGAVIANAMRRDRPRRARRPRGGRARARRARRRGVRAVRRQRGERHRRVGRPPASGGALQRGGGATHQAEPRYAPHASPRAARRAGGCDRARRRRSHRVRPALAGPHARGHDRQRLRGLGGARAPLGRRHRLPARGGERLLRHRAAGPPT